MKQLLKQVIRGTPLYHPLRTWAVKHAENRQLARWEAQGKPVPPPHVVKQRVLLEYARTYGLRILVETGTCYGDMVEAMRREFDRIYSIELSDALFAEARRRFGRARHVILIRGDSAVELGDIIKTLDQPALFWLDGHYSGGDTARGEKDTPILEEVGDILGSPETGHVVMVDDARLFGTDPAYPSIRELRAFIDSRRPGSGVRVEDDVIRITPGTPFGASDD